MTDHQLFWPVLFATLAVGFFSIFMIWIMSTVLKNDFNRFNVSRKRRFENVGTYKVAFVLVSIPYVNLVVLVLYWTCVFLKEVWHATLLVLPTWRKAKDDIFGSKK